MRTAIVEMKSLAPLSWGRRYLDPPKEDKESDADYEARTWKERFHYNADGHVIILPMAFKGALELAAKYLGMKIKGKGNATYAKHFRSGVMVVDPVVPVYAPNGTGEMIPYTRESVHGERLFVPSDGTPGGGRRVDKCFPFIPEWQGTVVYSILDDVITEPVFERHVRESGQFIGIGRFRPERRGFYGRFSVKDIAWSNESPM